MAIENQNWVKTQEKNMLFRVGKNGELPSRLLEISDTNRIVTPEQGQDGTVLSQIYNHLANYDQADPLPGGKDQRPPSGWDWLQDTRAEAEKYTLTAGKLQNSRSSFAEMYKSWISEFKEKSRAQGMGGGL